MAEARAEARAGRVAWSRWIKVCQAAPWDPDNTLEGNIGWLAARACRRRVGVTWAERGEGEGEGGGESGGEGGARRLESMN